MKSIFVQFCIICCVSIITPNLIGGTGYSLQAGTFDNRQGAESLSSTLKKQGVSPVYIIKMPGENATFSVRIGNFHLSESADAERQRYEYQGIKTEVISRENSVDIAKARSAVNGKAGDYFTAGPFPTTPKNYVGEFSELVTLKRRAAYAMPTTAPETLHAIKEYLDLIPDAHPLKGREAVNYSLRVFASRPGAYAKEPGDYSDIKVLLTKVGEQQIAATKKEMETARDKVVRILHYYDNDYISAIKAYKQLNRLDMESKKQSKIAIRNADLAGAIFELCRTTDFSTTETQDALENIWLQNNRIQVQYLTTNTKTAQNVRNATARIGLMLSESFLDSKDWTHADPIANSLIEMYSEYSECQGIVAEAWCHKAHINSALKRYNDSDQAADKAISIAQKLNRPVWGDPARDPLFKAFSWKYVNAQADRRFNERDAIAEEMKIKFKGNPGLKKYVQVEEEEE